jgi:regulator of cell morphogenesis and NO signaling
METIQENILDVTVLEPREKHPTIFRVFDNLAAGEHFTIHNDHDPKPLYYQLLGERGNIFTWEYEEEGPEWWKVKITKNAAGAKEETIGELAAKDLRKAEIFKKYGLDFCCGGKKTVKQACAAKGLDVTKIEQELQQADKYAGTRPLPYNEWNLDFLIDYILNTHHYYVQKTLPDLKAYAAKVAKVHGDHHPELVQVHQLVEGIYNELTSHMAKEERILFPYIKVLVETKSSGIKLDSPAFGSVESPINMMEQEHDAVGEMMESVHFLSNGYSLPEDACASYSLLYRTLKEFEDDLHMHIHLENNILFPKAIALEKDLVKGAIKNN